MHFSDKWFRTKKQYLCIAIKKRAVRNRRKLKVENLKLKGKKL